MRAALFLPARFAALPRLLALPLLALGASLAPAAAQDSSDAPIVVTAQGSLEDQIGGFVGALTKAPVNGQIARFETEICPAVLGVPDTFRAPVEARMRLVAGAAGLKVAKPGCSANVLVMVTQNKAQLLKTLRDKYPDFFSGKSPGEIRAILAQPGSAAAWQIDGMVNADGASMTMSDGAAINRTTRGDSRITAAARPTFTAAAVVVEAAALAGLSTTQLADYAVMRTFARTNPDQLTGSAPDTILTIIDAPAGTELPITMTQWDLGFLKGLYTSPRNLRAGAERSEIARAVKEELDKPAQPGQPEPE